MPTIQTTRVYREIDNAFKSGCTTISEQGSARSSKTYNTLIWIIVYCLLHANTRASIVRKTLPALKGSVLVDFKEIMRNMKIYNERSFNKSELIYFLPNGSWIEFFSTDDEQKIRGRKRNILYANEANELNEIEWQQLKMRTTTLSILDYNPSFSDEHWICSVSADPRTYHFITTYKDNPFLEQTIIDEIESLQHKNRSLWQIYGLGLMAQIEGLIFKNINLIDEFPLYVKKRYRGMDFGFSNDPTSIIELGVEGDNLYIDELCYRTQMLSKDIIYELKQGYGKVISESADPRLIQEISNAGINIHPVSKFQGSVVAGINKMLEYKINVTKRSYNTIKEFKNYTYTQNKDGKWLNEPIDLYNHSIDAIRYVILNEILGKNRQKKSLSGMFN